MTVIMKGAAVAASLKDNMLEEIESLASRGIKPGLAIIRLGERPDDLAYEKGAIKCCEGLGLACKVFSVVESIPQAELITKIEKINQNKQIHGLLLLRPLPRHIDENILKHVISPSKDIDCLNPINAAKVFEGDETGFAPCTPEAVIDLLEYYQVDVSGKNIVIIGRSMVVGKPLSMLLLKKHATVTICHSGTRNLPEICQKAQILITCAGKPKMITANYVSPGQTVVDVGINMDKTGNLCGDVDYENVEPIVGGITPVPGGVGTITTAVMARHVLRAAQNQI